MAAFGPDELSLPTTLALVFAFGYAVTGLVSFVLAALHALHPATFFVALAVVTAALWAAGIRRAGLGSRGAALRAEARGDGRWVLLVGGVVIVAIAVLRLGYSPALNLSSSTAWRYWADGKEIADAGRIPAASLQYGSLFSPTTSKVFLNVFTAGISFATGGKALPSLGALLWVGSVGLAAALWSFGHELGLRLTAPLLPVLVIMDRLFFNRETTSDLLTYKAEVFGRLVVFVAVAMAVQSLRGRTGRKTAALAGALFGVAVATHLVPVMVGGIVLAWFAVARLLLDRRLGAVVKPAAMVGAVAVVLGGLLLLIPHGDIGLRGAAGSSAYTRFAPGFDPTRYLNAGVLPGRSIVAPTTWDIAPKRALKSYVASAIPLRPGTAFGRLIRPLDFAVPIGGLLLAVAMLLWFPKDLRPIGLIGWGTAMALVALTWLFSKRYVFYIQSYFGIRRLYDYSSIPIILIGLALVEAGLLLLGRFRRWLPGVAAAVFVMLVAAIVLPSGRVPAGSVARSERLIAPIDWIRANVPCDARILANEHTEGVFEALTGRVAILEGMTPYLRPSVLVPALKMLLGANAFFHDAVGEASFLRREGVDYVMVIRAGVGYHEPIGKVDAAALDGAPFLRKVFGSEQLDVYRVDVAALPEASSAAGPPTGSFPDPTTVAGYDCERAPLPH